MRQTRKLKPRFVTLPALGLCLLASFAVYAPAGAQEEDARPKVISSQAPSYPPVAAAARARGKVIVEVRLDGEGRVSSAKAKSGPPLLFKVSEEAAARWRFEPAPRGEAVRTALLTFDFDPDETWCINAPGVISPYQMTVHAAFKSDSETESYLPADFKGKRCPVHRLALKADKVEIIYGLVMFDPDYMKVEKRRFPYANTVAYGGCVISTKRNPCDGNTVQLSPRFAEVPYCPACRAAEEKWQKAHGRHRG